MPTVGGYLKAWKWLTLIPLPNVRFRMAWNGEHKGTFKTWKGGYWATTNVPTGTRVTLVFLPKEVDPELPEEYVLEYTVGLVDVNMGAIIVNTSLAKIAVNAGLPIVTGLGVVRFGKKG